MYGNQHGLLLDALAHPRLFARSEHRHDESVLQLHRPQRHDDQAEAVVVPEHGHACAGGREAALQSPEFRLTEFDEQCVLVELRAVLRGREFGARHARQARSGVAGWRHRGFVLSWDPVETTPLSAVAKKKRGPKSPP